MSTPKHPEIEVTLIGEDSNAFNVIGSILRAMKAESVPEEERDAFTIEAMTGDYDHLLQTCMKWVTVI